MTTHSSPKVSVILATYNRGHLLQRSLASVLNQTYRNLEVIVVDDGSTDRIRQTVSPFDDPRVIYLRHSRNRGAAASRNTGVLRSTGKYIAFQDDDDEWLPEKLEKQLEILEKSSNRVGMVYSDMWKISPEGRRYFHSPRFLPSDGNVYRQALAYGLEFIGLGSVILRRECFDRIGLFDLNLGCFIDLELFIRISKYYCLHHINEPLVNYYSSRASVSSDPRRHINARLYIMKKYWSDLKKDDRAYAKQCLLLGRSCCDNGFATEGLRYLLRGLSRSRFHFAYFSYVSWYLFTRILRALPVGGGETLRTAIELKYYHSKYGKNVLL